MTDFVERRKEQLPIHFDRRIEERIAVLEIRSDNNDIRATDTQELLKKFISRFDDHVVAEENSTRALSNTLVRVTNTVDNLTNEIKRTNDTLVTFAGKVDITHEKVTKWDTVVKTIFKIAIVIATLTSGAWAVYVHFSEQPQSQQGK